MHSTATADSPMPSTRPSKAALAAATLADPRWAAVRMRDASADGRFYYSVQTTGGDLGFRAISESISE
jgi:AraC family transcriptional regulator, regulatory protein of adaptative response / methylated-DNA-[protein]-cysteine methyltransferase